MRKAGDGSFWRRLETPYEGSFYGVHALAGDVLIAYGLRGSIFVSPDFGRTWDARENAVPSLLMASLALGENQALVAGLGGNFHLTRDSGKTFSHWKPPGFGTGVADLISSKDGAIITVGEAGAVRLTLP